MDDGDLWNASTSCLCSLCASDDFPRAMRRMVLNEVYRRWPFVSSLWTMDPGNTR